MIKFIEKHWQVILSGSVILSLSLIVSTVWLYKLAVETMPELKDRIKEIEVKQVADIDKTYEKITQEMNASKTHSDTRIDKIETNLAMIKASLLSLRGELGKMPSEATLKELIASVSEISNKKASLFSEARLIQGASQGSQDNPFVNWSLVAKELNVNLDTEMAEKGTSDLKNIQVLITQGIVENSALWKVENNKLVVHSKDSIIIYTPKQNISHEELNDLAKELNGIKDLGIKSWLKPQSGYK